MAASTPGQPADESPFPEFVSVHQQQLASSGVPQHFWETLFYKLKNDVFDAGEVFSIVQVQYKNCGNDADSSMGDDADSSMGDDADYMAAVQDVLDHSWKVVVIKEGGINHRDPSHIYLVDHAWTYRVSMARTQLEKVPGLLERMVNLMEITSENVDHETLIENVLEEMWRYNQTYHIGNPDAAVEETLPIWYIMDEFGSRIQHSSKPTFRTVPFFYSDTSMAFTLIFPITSLDHGEEVTRNYIESPVSDPLAQQALLIPWFPKDMTTTNFCQRLHDQEFLQMSLQTQETLPDSTKVVISLPTDRPFRVFSQYKAIRENLRNSKFEITDNEDDADILWYTYHFKDFRNFRQDFPHKYINQFPYENRITVKDLLCVICRLSVSSGETFDNESLETYPLWLPTTFNLQTELAEFVSYYQQRQKKKLDNLWICKPWNLARSLDTHITKNLNYILRLPATGPKVACKYVETPLLFYRDDIACKVKFDIRYIVLLRSVQPLKVYVYRRFWLRFANSPFSLDHFDDYEKHFTVMNYTNGDQLHQMFCHDFIKYFDSQYPDYKYEHIQEDIFAMIKSVFVAATQHAPPEGIYANEQSRAMYAVDLILRLCREEKGVQVVRPMLLEVNWTPDCERACVYYPDFFDDVFSTLFLDKPVNAQLL